MFAVRGGVIGATGWTVPEAGREPAPETDRECWTLETGREDAAVLIPDAGLEDVRERPDWRRDTAGDGGAGREGVSDVRDGVLSLYEPGRGSWGSEAEGCKSRAGWEGSGEEGSWNGRMRQMERGMFSMETTKRGTNERRRLRGARARVSI